MTLILPGHFPSFLELAIIHMTSFCQSLCPVPHPAYVNTKEVFMWCLQTKNIHVFVNHTAMSSDCFRIVVVHFADAQLLRDAHLIEYLVQSIVASTWTLSSYFYLYSDLGYGSNFVMAKIWYRLNWQLAIYVSSELMFSKVISLKLSYMWFFSKHLPEIPYCIHTKS